MKDLKANDSMVICYQKNWNLFYFIVSRKYNVYFRIKPHFLQYLSVFQELTGLNSAAVTMKERL